MEKIKVKIADVQKAFAETNASGQAVLSTLFGNSLFETKITDRVKTYEDACVVLGISEMGGHGLNCTKDEIAFKKLKIIIQALNEGWTPNWNDDDEYKFYPWFNMQDGFVLNLVICHYTLSNVGSRLCFKSRELAEYAVKQFGDLYKDFMVIE